MTLSSLPPFTIDSVASSGDVLDNEIAPFSEEEVGATSNIIK